MFTEKHLSQIKDSLKTANDKLCAEALFMNDAHREFYIMNIQKTNSFSDPYRKALFYALGLTAETRNNINSLYDFADNAIDFDGLNRPWQTGTSAKVTKLAFNLYNGFCGDLGGEPIDYPSDYTPYNLFGNELMNWMFEAVKLLYPCYNNRGPLYSASY
ncbi:hypothetical protein DFR58_101120 [Anaerobacterium chartisolvens]|uniref:Uncharacterized protein n=1 Tax=Anaerobacterium chartisolvens TaxID=1297424 RepID=A0A369BJY3_9FIRM|nr:DUF6075 family protein [Anaerobacterium chartisolvens]RCX20918.1 hypothetical protein DFR58_101120 [Anaerobacterium chartisolvens]